MSSDNESATTLTNGAGSYFTDGRSATKPTGGLLTPDTASIFAAASSIKNGTDQDIHGFLRGVRLDEIVGLSQSKSSRHTVKEDSDFPASFYIPLFSYIQYLWQTWTNIVVLFIHMEIPWKDFALTVFLSTATSLILFFALLWCQFANNPFIYKHYFDWANRHAHGLGLVNAADPGLFNKLTPDQASAAKKKLGVKIEDAVSTRTNRVFDLDIAKLLLQLSSVVYERAPTAIHKTLEAISESTKAHPPQKKHLSASCTSSDRHSQIRPTLAHPHLSQYKPSPLASPEPTKLNLSGASTPAIGSGPGDLVRDVFPEAIAKKIEATFKAGIADPASGHNAITGFCEKIDIEYEAVSELNNSSSAYCSFFWDAKSNWIVVCFKGTGIAEYADWVTDLTTTMVPADDFLPGYSRAIKGFKERIWPTEVNSLGATRPWDTIRYSLCKVSEKLARERADEGKEGKINVWFTGHSLGCALATLAYARAINSPGDWAGYPISIRDCYIFAAPVSADRATAAKFNDEILNGDAVRTMWRVRNAGDAVATLLPQLGDRSDLVKTLSPTNPAGFAHLGTEIIMHDSPSISGVCSPTDHLGGTPSDFSSSPNPIRVEIRSDFTRGEILKARNAVLKEKGEEARETFFNWAEKIPLIGRFVAHDTVLYWDQLDRIAIGGCKWVDS